MPWTNKQKQLAVRACAEAGISEEYRKLILLQLPNAKFDRQGRAVAEPTSTSARLNNSDYEMFMATVEHAAPSGQLLHFSAGYWQRKAADETSRLRFRVRELDLDLRQRGLLNESGLGGWIARMTAERTRQLDELTAAELGKLIEGLKAFGSRRALQPA